MLFALPYTIYRKSTSARYIVFARKYYKRNKTCVKLLKD